MARQQASSARRSVVAAWFARLLLRVGALLLALVVLLMLLSVAYRVVPPVSTLMLARWATLQPVTREWVPLSAISQRLVEAVVMAEDARFCQHCGVDWDALHEVINDDEGPSRGASTLTMQVAKNLFLWPSKSYVRKGLEIPLALWLDIVWSKRRTIEVYLNIAEWGPGIFGVQAAARASFGKDASALSPREAALLATALPNPIRRQAARPGRGHQRLATIVAERAKGAATYLQCLRP
jgi:monofunctional biosynthetic peptidoglycan transglycosylase